MTIPIKSSLYHYANNAYFSDSHSASIPYHGETALMLFTKAMRRTPAWMNATMNARNKVVALFGLKNLGAFKTLSLNKVDYAVGDRIGIFTLVSQTSEELIVEDRDKHLTVRVSFLVESHGQMATIHASTVVHVNNLLGKAYMAIVTSPHKLIVPQILKKLKG